MSNEYPVHNRKVPGNTRLQPPSPFQGLRHSLSSGSRASTRRRTETTIHDHSPWAESQAHVFPWWHRLWPSGLAAALYSTTNKMGLMELVHLRVFPNLYAASLHFLSSLTCTHTHTHTHTQTHAVYTWGSLWLPGFLIKKVEQHLRKTYHIKRTVQNLRASPGPRASQECDPRLRTHSLWDAFSREASNAGWNVLSCR